MSHKFNGPGLKYEIGISLKNGYCVWIRGPFLPSENDKTTFHRELAAQIPEGKLGIADGGYEDKDNTKLSFPNPYDQKHVRKYKSDARCRHETFNKRIKVFEVLSG